MNQLIGFLLVALALILALLVGTPAELFIDPYSVLLILGCVLGSMFLSYGAQAFSIFKYANQPVKNQKEYFWVISFFDHLSNTSVLVGILGSLLGQVAILSNVEDKSSLFPSMSICFLTTLYGFALAKFVIEPLKQNVLRHAQVANINANVQRQIEQNNKLAHNYSLLALFNLALCFVLLVVYL